MDPDHRVIRRADCTLISYCLTEMDFKKII